MQGGDVFVGFMVVVVSLTIGIASISGIKLYGHNQALNDIESDCRNFGHFAIDDVVYVCEKQEGE